MRPNEKKLQCWLCVANCGWSLMFCFDVTEQRKREKASTCAKWFAITPSLLVNLLVSKVWGGDDGRRPCTAYWRLARLHQAAAVTHTHIYTHTRARAVLPDTQMCSNGSRVSTGILSKVRPCFAPVFSVCRLLLFLFASLCLELNQMCQFSVQRARLFFGVKGATDWPLGRCFDFRLSTWCKYFCLIRSDYTKQLQRDKLKVTDGGWSIYMRKYKLKCQGGGKKTLTLTRNVAIHCLRASEKHFWGNFVTSWLTYLEWKTLVATFTLNWCWNHKKEPFQWRIGAVF